MGRRGPARTWTPIRRALIESSIWGESPEVCKLWVTLLLIADEPGRAGDVDMPLEILAARARLPVPVTKRCLATLMAPDPDSRSRECEGRRVAPIDPARTWGWRLLNWERHRIAIPGSSVETAETPETFAEGKGGEGKGYVGGRSAPLETWLRYAKERYPWWPATDAESAHDYYGKVNWVVGKARVPVKDWRLCVKTCANRWLAEHPNVDPTRVIL